MSTLFDDCIDAESTAAEVIEVHHEVETVFLDNNIEQDELSVDLDESHSDIDSEHSDIIADDGDPTLLVDKCKTSAVEQSASDEDLGLTSPVNESEVNISPIQDEDSNSLSEDESKSSSNDEEESNTLPKDNIKDSLKSVENDEHESGKLSNAEIKRNEVNKKKHILSSDSLVDKVAQPSEETNDKLQKTNYIDKTNASIESITKNNADSTDSESESDEDIKSATDDEEDDNKSSSVVKADCSDDLLKAEHETSMEVDNNDSESKVEGNETKTKKIDINTNVDDTKKMDDKEPNDLDTTNELFKPSRELKLLLESSKEANLNTNIAHKRKSMDPSKTEDSDGRITPRARRSQNPEFVAKHQKFLSKVVGEESKTMKQDDNDSINAGKRKRNSSTNEKITIDAADDLRSRKMFKPNRSFVKSDKDAFCWRCHKDSVTISCETCPRSFHSKCLKQHVVADPEHWPCPECVSILKAESTKTRPASMKDMTLEHLCSLLKFALKRMIQLPDSTPFQNPVNEKDFPDYKKYIVQPMDLTKMDKNIKANLYGSPNAFEADSKWILHNSMIFNSHQSRLNTTAKAIVKICKQEMSEIENCSNCYLNANTKEDWFVEVCPKPHILVWAKLKGFPYWPAKSMCYNQLNMVDVRFFGKHDRAWVSFKDCYLYSVQNPNSHQSKKNDINKCIKEVNIYIDNLKKVHGEFRYAPFRTNFDPTMESKYLVTFLPKYKPLKVQDVMLKKLSKSSVNSDKSLSNSSGDKSILTDDFGNDSEEKDCKSAEKHTDIDDADEDSSRDMDTSRASIRHVTGDDDCSETASIDYVDPPAPFHSIKNASSTPKKKDYFETSLIKTNTPSRMINKNETSRLSDSIINFENSKESIVDTHTDMNTETGDEKSDDKNINMVKNKQTKISDKLIKKLTDSIAEDDTAKSNEVVAAEDDINEEKKDTNIIQDEAEGVLKSTADVVKDTTEAEKDEKDRLEPASKESSETIQGTIQENKEENKKENSESKIEENKESKNEENNESKNEENKESKNEEKKECNKEGSMSVDKDEKEDSVNKEATSIIKIVPEDNQKESTKLFRLAKGKDKCYQNKKLAQLVEKQNDGDICLKVIEVKEELEEANKEKTNTDEKTKESVEYEENDLLDVLYTEKVDGPKTSNTNNSNPIILNKNEDIARKLECARKMVDKKNADQKKKMTEDILNKLKEPGMKLDKSTKAEAMFILNRDYRGKDRAEYKKNAQKIDKIIGIKTTSNSPKPQNTIIRKKNVEPINKKRKLSADLKENNSPSRKKVLTDSELGESSKNNYVSISSILAKENKATDENESILLDIKSEPQSTEEDEISENEYMEAKLKLLSALNISEKRPIDPHTAKKANEIRTRSKTEEKNNKVFKIVDNLTQCIDDVALDRDEGGCKKNKKGITKQRARKTFTNSKLNSVQLKQIQMNAKRTKESTNNMPVCSTVDKINPQTSMVTTSTQPPNLMFFAQSQPMNNLVGLPSNQLTYTPGNQFLTMLPNSSNAYTNFYLQTSSQNLIPTSIPTANMSLSSLQNSIQTSIQNSIQTSIQNSLQSSLQNEQMQTPDVVEIHNSSDNSENINDTGAKSRTPLQKLSQKQLAIQKIVATQKPMPVAMIQKTGFQQMQNGIQPHNSSTLAQALSSPARPHNNLPQCDASATQGETIINMEDFGLLQGLLPNTVAKAMSELICQAPPKLKPRPPGALSTHFDEGTPSVAGPVTANINSIAHRLTDYFRGMLIETLSDVGKTDNSEAMITHLKLENESLKHKHNEEILEIKKNVNTILKDIQKSILEEKEKIYQDTRASCDLESIKRVEEAKLKQWCANCLKEAQFYCCWNTSYCDYPCQTKHWPKHMPKCTQSSGQNQGPGAPGKSTPIVLRQTAPPKGVTKAMLAKTTKVIVNRAGASKLPMNLVRASSSQNHITLVESTPGNFELVGNGPISVDNRSNITKLMSNPTILNKIKSGGIITVTSPNSANATPNVSKSFTLQGQNTSKQSTNNVETIE